MSLDPEKDVKVASIARVKDSAKKTEEDTLKSLEEDCLLYTSLLITTDEIRVCCRFMHFQAVRYGKCKSVRHRNTRKMTL